MFVHDLNLFVTVQVLDETPAVLSLGKLCEDHGYFYEWVSGQKPRLTKDGKTIICKTDNFVRLVVPGLSTSLSQDSLRKPPASSSSSSSVSERSDALASRRLVLFPKILNQNKKRDDRKKSDDRVADLPEWLQECKENLKETELHASAHSSPESDPEYPTTLATKSRKRSVKTHFPEDRDCEICGRTKLTMAPCRRRTGEALPRAEKFGDLMTADHKVLNEGCESRDNHRYAVVAQDLATQWIQSYPCKAKIFAWDIEKFVKIPGAVAQTESCIYWQLDGIWESMWRFIMESPHFNTSSIRDKWHRWKIRSKSKRRHFSNIATVRTVWKVVVRFYGMLLLSAKCPRPLGGWENSVWKTIWRSSPRANNTFWSTDWIPSVPSDFSKRPIKNSSIWQESITRNLSWLWASRGENLERRYSDCGSGRFGKDGRIRHWSSKNQRERNTDEFVFRADLGGIWKGDFLMADLEDLEQLDASDILSSKNQRERNTDQTKRWWIHIPICRWYSKIVRKRPRIPRIHSKARTNRKERRSQQRTSWWTGRVSSDRIRRWRWNPCRLLVDPRVTSPIVITMNLGFNSTCRRKKHSLFHWNFFDVTRYTHTDLHVLQEKRIDDYWNVETSRHLSDSWKGFTTFTLLKEKPPKGYMWSGERLTKIRTTSRPDHVWPEVWMKIGEAAQNREKHEWAKEKPKLDNARKMRGIYFIDPDDEECKEILKNARRKLERSMAAVMPCKRQRKWFRCRKLDPRRIPKQCMIVQWNLNPRDNERNLHSPKIMRITLQVKDLLRCLIAVCFTSSSRCQPQAMKVPDAKGCSG